MRRAASRARPIGECEEGRTMDQPIAEEALEKLATLVGD
jgi:hypothetical protein